MEGKILELMKGNEWETLEERSYNYKKARNKIDYDIGYALRSNKRVHNICLSSKVSKIELGLSDTKLYT